MSGVGNGVTPAAAEIVLALIVAAVPRLREKFARPEEVDKATLRHFVERGMSAAPESSEEEKGENPARPSRASEASAKRASGCGAPTRARPCLVAAALLWQKRV